MTDTNLTAKWLQEQIADAHEESERLSDIADKLEEEAEARREDLLSALEEEMYQIESDVADAQDEAEAAAERVGVLHVAAAKARAFYDVDLGGVEATAQRIADLGDETLDAFRYAAVILADHREEQRNG